MQAPFAYRGTKFPRIPVQPPANALQHGTYSNRKAYVRQLTNLRHAAIWQQASLPEHSHAIQLFRNTLIPFFTSWLN